MNSNKSIEHNSLKEMGKYWDMKKHRCIEKCPHADAQYFMPLAIHNDPSKDRILELIKSCKEQGVNISGEQVMREYYACFPGLFKNYFEYMNLNTIDEPLGFWSMYPFDSVNNGKCDVELSIKKLQYVSNSGKYENDCGFIRPVEVPAYDADVLESLRMITAGHRPVVSSNKRYAVWNTPPSLPGDKELGIDFSMLVDKSEIKGSLPAPDSEKVHAISFLYDEFKKMGKQELGSITEKAMISHYGDVVQLTDIYVLGRRRKTGCIYIELNPSRNKKLPFKRPHMPPNAPDSLVHKHLMRFASLPDPFAPLWYVGIAARKHIKMIFESVNVIMRLAKIFMAFKNDSLSIEVAGITKNLEPIALSVPKTGNLISFLTGSVTKVYDGRSDIKLIPSSFRTADFLIDFSPLSFPSLGVSEDTAYVLKMLNFKIGEFLKEKKKVWNVMAFKVDYRYALYLKDSYNFVPDIDPISMNVWLLTGLGDTRDDIKVGDVFVKKHFDIKKALIEGLNLRMDYLRYKLTPSQVLIKRFDFFDVDFCFGEGKKLLELDLVEEVVLDGILPDDDRRNLIRDESSSSSDDDVPVPKSSSKVAPPSQKTNVPTSLKKEETVKTSKSHKVLPPVKAEPKKKQKKILIKSESSSSDSNGDTPDSEELEELVFESLGGNKDDFDGKKKKKL